MRNEILRRRVRSLQMQQARAYAGDVAAGTPSSQIAGAA
jgi:heme exporter protein C